jgi:hypothetical protein
MKYTVHTLKAVLTELNNIFRVETDCGQKVWWQW